VVASLRQDSATRARESARIAALVEGMIDDIAAWLESPKAADSVARS
jgi:hypothetical protein